jgi:hypothetical protein
MSCPSTAPAGFDQVHHVRIKWRAMDSMVGSAPDVTLGAVWMMVTLVMV